MWFTLFIILFTFAYYIYKNNATFEYGTQFVELRRKTKHGLYQTGKVYALKFFVDQNRLVHLEHISRTYRDYYVDISSLLADWEYFQTEYKTFPSSGRSYKDYLLIKYGDESLYSKMDTQKHSELQLENLLVLGTTGSGKSLFLESYVMDLVKKYSSSELNLVLVDMTTLQFSGYESLPHVRIRITQPLEFINFFSEESSNVKFVTPTLVIIDEYLKLSHENETEVNNLVNSMLNKHSSNIFFLISSGLAEAFDGIDSKNELRKICFMVGDSKESIQFLGTSGAEKLKGKGDMYTQDSKTKQLTRAQATYLSQNDIHETIKALCQHEKKKFSVL